jgi:2-oxoglutarate dehydrogenase complex dehydrogenase (E1) component-like enzyme
MQDIAIVRIEQLAPLHYSNLVEIFEKYSNASDIIWFQEEHKNAGAWSYIYPRISVLLEVLKKKGKIQTDELQCISRKTSASPAVGKKSKHDFEQS